MRASAFVFSLLAALYGVVMLVLYAYVGTIGSPFLAWPFGTPPSGDNMILLALLFALPVINIVGGGITLQFLWPGVLLTLVAAAGWVFAGILLGLGVSLNEFNITPLALCGLAAVLSFLGGFESERVAAWIAGLLSILIAGLLGFLIFDYYRGEDSMFFAPPAAATSQPSVPGLRVPQPSTDVQPTSPGTGSTGTGTAGSTGSGSTGGGGEPGLAAI